MKTRVRFHLGKGEHYRHWQVTRGDEVAFYDPFEVRLKMTGCRLKSRRKTADRIHAGENKAVCAWISCESVEVAPPREEAVADPATLLFYNPRFCPFWTSMGGIENLDGVEFEEVTSYGKALVAVGRKDAA